MKIMSLVCVLALLAPAAASAQDVLFADDFENGARPEWIIENDQWVAEDGHLRVTTACGLQECDPNLYADVDLQSEYIVSFDFMVTAAFTGHGSSVACYVALSNPVEPYEAATSGYVIGCGWSPDGSAANANGGIQRIDNSTYTDLALQTGEQYWIEPNVLYHMKLGRLGTQLVFKKWTDGDPEPEWQLSVTDMSYSGGYFMPTFWNQVGWIDNVVVQKTGALTWTTNAGGNGHSYELIRVNNPIRWQDAKLHAESMGGHLATITSESENNWVWGQVVHPRAQYFDWPVLLGAYHDRELGPTLGWSWVTGEPWAYQAWREGEPNGKLGSVDRGDFLSYASCNVQGWNDTGDTPSIDPNYYYLVEYDGIHLQVSDVPDDQGGFLNLQWNASSADAPNATNPVTSYTARRFESDSWSDLVTVPATQVGTYQVTIATPDILTIGQPAPLSRYCIVATGDELGVEHVSTPDSACSIDNLPPPRPVAGLSDSPTYRVIYWVEPTIDDLQSMCVFRGPSPGFAAAEPLECPQTMFFNETDLGWYFYRVQFADIHGNLSELSDELHGQFPTGVDGILPRAQSLEQNSPNPFNPSTAIRFSVPGTAPISLDIYDVSGKLIRRLISDQLVAGGHHECVWDSRDEQGRTAPAGVYFYKLVAGGKAITRRMALIK